MSFTLTVSGFDRGGPIPHDLTCDGADRSPALSWADAPAGTKSFALILDDPDAPGGVWNHWLLWNIPGSALGLGEGAQPQAPVRVGANDFGKQEYGGPCPPRRHGPHRYFFRLLALDVERLDAPAGAKRAELDEAVEPHVLATAEYMGRYERR